MSYRRAVLLDNPVGYWRLGETVGSTAADETENGSYGAYNNSPALGEDGLVSGGKSIVLTQSSNQYVSIPHIAAMYGGDGFSVEIWFKPTDDSFNDKQTNNASVIVEKRTPSEKDGDWGLYVTDTDEVGWRVYTETNQVAAAKSGSAKLVSGETYHLVLVYDNDTGDIKGYINGDLDLDDSHVSGAADGDTDHAIWIGRNDQGDFHYGDGNFAEFAIYDFALTQAQVQSHYAARQQTHHITGTVKQDGNNVIREIRAIDFHTKALLATQDSTDGVFDIGLTSADPVLVQAIPAEGYAPLIKGPYTPKSLKDFRAAVEALSPTHWWRLDGDFTDSGSYARHMTAQGSPTTGNAGLHSQGTSVRFSDGNAISLSGAGPLNDLIGASSITAEMIVEPTANEHDDYQTLLFLPISTGAGGIFVSRDNGNFYIGARTQSGETFRGLVGGAIANDEATHIMAVFSPENDRIATYINGSLDDEDTSVGFSNTTFTAAASTASWIGALASGHTTPTKEFTGFIHEVILYDKALTPTEIANNYAQLQGLNE